jgi:hypothetical protein
MPEEIQQKRFMKLIEMLSSTGCYCYVRVGRNIAPTGNDNDSKHKRPDHIHM